MTAVAKNNPYRVGWSEEDAVFIVRIAEFPSLAAHGETAEEAIAELQFVISEVIKDLETRSSP